jgi:hypothetical protein
MGREGSGESGQEAILHEAMNEGNIAGELELWL